MIFRIIYSLILYIGIVSCTQLPKIYPHHPSGQRPPLKTESICLNMFPQGRWQLFHAIEANVPGNSKNRLTGVSILDSKNQSIKWALMTIEGFVLFSGHYDDGKLSIDRAVTPFNKAGFAKGVLEALRLIFFKPFELQDIGFSENRDMVCRYGNKEGTTDIFVKANRQWLLHHYSSRNRLTQTIAVDQVVHIGNSFLPKHLILENHGLIGYKLDMHLLEAVPMN